MVLLPRAYLEVLVVVGSVVWCACRVMVAATVCTEKVVFIECILLKNVSDFLFVCSKHT